MKLMVIEDDVDLQKELQILLQNNGYEVLTITNFTNVLAQIKQNIPDLLLLDIQLPNLDGQHLLKEIRKEFQFPVMIVTSRNTTLDEVFSMSLGADDYISKPYSPQVLLLRIEAILRRTQRISNTLTYRDVTLNLSKGLVEKQEQKVLLSKNELMIFHFLLEHKGTIVSREEIMNYLWDTEEFIDDNTLTVNMNRLRNKLAELGLVDVIETRRGQGYLLV